MSLASWKREFYPITAEQAAKRGDLAAAKHSLRKWEGALPENAERHGVTVERVWIVAKGGKADFEFGADTCALCERHRSLTCSTCPLLATQGDQCGSGARSAYDAMANNGNPRPMIAALRKTVARLRKERA